MGCSTCKSKSKNRVKTKNVKFETVDSNTEEREERIDNKILNFINHFRSKNLPTMPFGAKILMEKYQIPEGITLGNKLKMIEEEWVNNNFQLSEKQITKIIEN